MQLWHRWEKQMHCHFTDIITGNQVPKVTQLEEEPEMQGKNAFYPALSWALSQIGPPQMNETQDWSLPATFCPRHLSLYIVRLLWHGAFSIHWGPFCFQFSSVQSPSRIWLFATPWSAAYQASLSITNSWSLLKLMSIALVMPSNYLILLSSPSPPTFNLSQHQGLFQWAGSLHPVVKVLEFQLQHQSFQWVFRTDFL